MLEFQDKSLLCYIKTEHPAPMFSSQKGARSITLTSVNSLCHVKDPFKNKSTFKKIITMILYLTLSELPLEKPKS